METVTRPAALRTSRLAAFVACAVASLGWQTSYADTTYGTARLGDGPTATAGKLTARDVTAAMFKAGDGERPDLSGRDLSNLDLAGLNFKSANLSNTNLYGADLSAADLSGVDLSGAKLDRAIIVRSSFKSAKLDHATLLKPSVFSDVTFDHADSPDFTGASLREARISARMDGGVFRNADVSRAHFGPTDRTAEAGIAPSSRMMGADFSGAIMVGTKLHDIDFTFGRFVGADLRNAELLNLDLSRADFTGADLTGADLTGCNLDATILSGVKGLETVTGLATVRNLERALR